LRELFSVLFSLLNMIIFKLEFWSIQVEHVFHLLLQCRLNEEQSLFQFSLNIYLLQLIDNSLSLHISLISKSDLRGRDRMVIGFITTYAISAFHH
jgi:hypothetical protein